jgi:microcompartment protein CcmL/EutN
MVHPDVVQAIGKIIPTTVWDAIGIIETFSVVSGIEAADRAIKVGGIRIIEIRLAIGYGGKSYVKMIGNLDAVQAAMEAGTNVAREKNQLCMSTLIPHPHNETKPYFFQ